MSQVSGICALGGRNRRLKCYKLTISFRFRTSSLSVKCDLPTLKQIDAIHKESVALLKDCDGFVPSILYQPLLGPMLPSDETGNALGIKLEDTPLISMLETQHFTVRKCANMRLNSCSTSMEVDRHST